MPCRHAFPLVAILLAVSVPAFSENTPPPHLSKETRQKLITVFNSELVYVRTPFPMGKVGLKLRNGVTSPNGMQLQQMMSLWGPAAKPGDQVRITDIRFKGDYIHFEFNGGPVKKKKWYQRIEVSGAGGSTPVAPSDENANARGSFVDLYFDNYIPEITGPELKQLLRPVFDFDSKSPLEAFLETVPPKVRDAIKAHNVLVGMNREMVIYSKGRPPKKVRERDNEIEYEDWIYGDPPKDVDFVRLVGDEVVRVETMKVDGQKVVRTEKEVDLGEATAVAKKEQERPINAPTLRRPGEDLPGAEPAGGINPTPPRASPPANDPQSSPVPN